MTPFNNCIAYDPRRMGYRVGPRFVSDAAIADVRERYLIIGVDFAKTAQQVDRILWALMTKPQRRRWAKRFIRDQIRGRR